MESLHPDGLTPTTLAEPLGAVIGVIAVASMFAAVRALFSVSAVSVAACRRWAWRATTASFAVLAAPAATAGADATLLVSLAAIDCWLVVLVALVAARRPLPHAVALRPRRPSGARRLERVRSSPAG